MGSLPGGRSRTPHGLGQGYNAGMPDAVFIVPVAAEATARFLRAATLLPDVRLAVVSQQPAGALPEEIRTRLAGHAVVKDCLDPQQLLHGVMKASWPFGARPHALMAILEQLQEPLAWVRQELSIPGMGLEAASNFRDKSRMKDVLRAHDVPCAGHALANTADEARAFAHGTGYPLVVKPPAGAGGRNTFRVEDDAQLEDSLRGMPPTSASPVLLEEFMTGKEHSFDSISIAGKHIFHSISNYTPTPLEVMSTPWIQWCVHLPREIDTPEYADILEVGPKALDALGMDTGMTHMEWFRRPDGSLAISEVAARPPGAQFTSLISHAHDRDFYRAWAEVVIFGRFTPPQRKYSVGAAYLRGQGEGRVKSIRGLELVQEELGDLVVEAKLPQPEQGPSGSYEGEGYVILRHPETKVVEEGLQRLVSCVQVQMG